MKDRRFDLEGELHADRPRPRDEFATALAGEVRGASQRARQGRFGLWLALTGLSIVAIASFGGVAYADSHPTSAASAQYDTPTIPTTTEATKTEPATVQANVVPQKFTPPTAKPKAHVVKHAKAKKNVVHRVQVAGATKASNVAPKVVKSGQLPFTGLALWIPLAFGLVLIAAGVTLRTKARRRGGPATH